MAKNSIANDLHAALKAAGITTHYPHIALTNGAEASVLKVEVLNKQGS